MSKGPFGYIIIVEGKLADTDLTRRQAIELAKQYKEDGYVSVGVVKSIVWYFGGNLK